MTRAHLFCHIEDRAAADGVLTLIFGGDQTGSFSVPVGDTHFGCSGVLEDETIGRLGNQIACYLEGTFEEAVQDVLSQTR